MSEYPGCPACGEPIDYCSGHGEFGDPVGYARLTAHDRGDHSECHPEGCDEAQPGDCPWCGRTLPRAKMAEHVGRHVGYGSRPAFEDDPKYRAEMKDAGRGGLLRG